MHCNVGAHPHPLDELLCWPYFLPNRQNKHLKKGKQPKLWFCACVLFALPVHCCLLVLISNITSVAPVCVLFALLWNCVDIKCTFHIGGSSLQKCSLLHFLSPKPLSLSWGPLIVATLVSTLVTIPCGPLLLATLVVLISTLVTKPCGPIFLATLVALVSSLNYYTIWPHNFSYACSSSIYTVMGPKFLATLVA